MARDWTPAKKCVSQNTRDEGARYAKDSVSTVAVDRSQKGARGKYAAVGYGIVQLCFDHEGGPKYGEYGTVPAKCECQHHVQTMRSRQNRQPVLTDTLGDVQGPQERHTVRLTNQPHADEWKMMNQALRRVKQEVGWETQSVVGLVKTHGTSENRRSMNDKEQFDTDGTGRLRQNEENFSIRSAFHAKWR